MYRAEDAVAGKGQNRRKPHTSVLPYLKAKEEDRDKGGNKPTASKAERVEKQIVIVRLEDLLFLENDM